MVGKASLVIRNGQICTVDKLRSWAQALAASGDKIVFVGSMRARFIVGGIRTRFIVEMPQQFLFFLACMHFF